MIPHSLFRKWFLLTKELSVSVTKNSKPLSLLHLFSKYDSTRISFIFRFRSVDKSPNFTVSWGKPFHFLSKFTTLTQNLHSILPSWKPQPCFLLLLTTAASIELTEKNTNQSNRHNRDNQRNTSRHARGKKVVQIKLVQQWVSFILRHCVWSHLSHGLSW